MTNSAKEILEQLKAPFNPDAVKKRYANMATKSGKILHYVDARTVMQRLDEVVGIDGWQTTLTVQCEKTLCQLSLKINNKWLVKTDGAGDTKIAAEKGGVSDAFKRAAVLFGVGRYLYEGKDPKVVYNNYHKKKNKLPKLEKLLNKMKKKKTKVALEEWKTDLELEKLTEKDLQSFKKEYLIYIATLKKE